MELGAEFLQLRFLRDVGALYKCQDPTSTLVFKQVLVFDHIARIMLERCAPPIPTPTSAASSSEYHSYSRHGSGPANINTANASVLTITPGPRSKVDSTLPILGMGMGMGMSTLASDALLCAVFVYEPLKRSSDDIVGLGSLGLCPGSRGGGIVGEARE